MPFAETAASKSMPLLRSVRFVVPRKLEPRLQQNLRRHLHLHRHRS
ncbi:MAG: hypothetical protein U1F19_05960 [Lysobacterales bacterium]